MIKRLVSSVPRGKSPLSQACAMLGGLAERGDPSTRRCQGEGHGAADAWSFVSINQRESHGEGMIVQVSEGAKEGRTCAAASYDRHKAVNAKESGGDHCSGLMTDV